MLCWGRNDHGQIGDNSTTNRLTPASVSGLSSGVVGVFGGASHTCAIKSGGSVYCWGKNTNGQLGDGTNVDKHVPTPVYGPLSGIVAMAAYEHTCALSSSGGLLCWGDNSWGQLGNGTNAQQWIPTPVVGFP